MTIENKLKNFIIDKYGTVANFTHKSGIASSTIFTVFKRGVAKTSTTTILKICTSLGIDSQALINGEIKIIAPCHPVDNIKNIDEILYELESNSFQLQYNGKILSSDQRRMIAYATRLSLMMVLKNEE